jgi:predicted negative regulator of RcsB-dependent stress response
MKFNNRNRSRSGRGLSGLLLAGMLCASPLAWALSKDDVVRLQASGLSPELMVQVIRASTEPVSITPAEVEELRAMGVAPLVLDEICMRVGCGAPAQGGMMTGPGGPSFDAEMQRQRELEAERLRLEQQRMAAEQEAMRARLAAEQARAAESGATFSALVEADRLYRARRFAEASAAYDQYMTSVQTDANTVDYYQALTGFVRSMHARGYRQLIRNRTLQAVQYGPNSPSFAEMLTILTDVTNDSQFLDPRFEEMASYTLGNLDGAVQDRYNFFMGRFYWAYDDRVRAEAFFRRLSDESPDRAKAFYLLGSMFLEAEENSSAIRNFGQALDAAQRSENDDVRELAALALARISFEIGQYDLALYYYRMVRGESFRHPRAIFESMWVHYMKQDYDRTLGAVHALHSPYYERWMQPETWVVEAATYFLSCNLEEAEATVRAFDERMDPVLAEVQRFIANTSSPQAYWDAVMTWHDRQNTASPTGLPIEAVRYVMSQAEFIEKLQLLGQLRHELEMLDADASGLGSFGTSVRPSLQSDIATKEIEAGLAISAMVRRFSSELSDWDIKAQEVGLEVTTARLMLIDAALEGRDSGSAGTTVFVLGSDWQFWPFEGEYWLDEVDNYRGRITNYRSTATGQCVNPDFVSSGP